MADAKDAWPTELRLLDDGAVLRVAFEDSSTFDLPAEYLRVSSPSAEVQGHSRRERKLVGGKRRVAVIGIDPIGSYAVKLSFDDMHDTGIYTWSYLHELGAQHTERWGEYLADLARLGLDRDRAGEATREQAGRGAE